MAPATPRQTGPIRDWIEAYRTVLSQLWLLNSLPEPRGERAREADLADARRLLDLQAKLCDELGPEFAAAISRDHARRWAALMHQCPWCGQPGERHE